MENAKCKIKAIALFSGGLDSTLAIKLILDQGVEVIPVHFVTIFQGLKAQKSKGALGRSVKDTLGLELKEVFVGDDYLEMIKNPAHGYGGNFNPCVDCKIFMLKKAKEMMPELGASFLITGEVLGQRPMSQRKDALMVIERDADVKGLLVRPLSGKILPQTLAEKNNWIKRELMADIYGRGRNPQIKLAKDLGIEKYAQPAGGCMLTEEGFCRKLEALASRSWMNLNEISLLKSGRLFILDDETRFYCGREQAGNEFITSLAQPNDILLMTKEIPGPSGLLRGNISRENKILAARIISRYAIPGGEAKVELKIIPSGDEEIISAQALSDTETQKYMV
jgi:tRNA U34 2-thiouridine synthase MnmA/TrmU